MTAKRICVECLKKDRRISELQRENRLLVKQWEEMRDEYASRLEKGANEIERHSHDIDKYIVGLENDAEELFVAINDIRSAFQMKRKAARKAEDKRIEAFYAGRLKTNEEAKRWVKGAAAGSRTRKGSR